MLAVEEVGVAGGQYMAFDNLIVPSWIRAGVHLGGSRGAESIVMMRFCHDSIQIVFKRRLHHGAVNILPVDETIAFDAL